MRQVPLLITPEPDEPGEALALVDGTVAGRPYRFILDTGAARSQLEDDEYTAALPAAAPDGSSGALGGRAADPVVTVTDLAVGPLRAATLQVTRARRDGPHVPNLLGMDVLGACCCHFRLDAGVLELAAPPGHRADRDLLLGRRGHVYLDLHWPGVTARACWDTGSSATLVNRDFWRAHPDLFEEIGMTSGTDAHGAQAATPVLMMAAPVIGPRAFARHRVAAADLSAINRSAEHPMDLIIGYPTLRQADWLFDFPAKRWTLTS
jgi:gag-polyprotein putative aspartyl protease